MSDPSPELLASMSPDDLRGHMRKLGYKTQNDLAAAIVFAASGLFFIGLALGGTAVGTGLNAGDDYRVSVVGYLAVPTYFGVLTTTTAGWALLTVAALAIGAVGPRSPSYHRSAASARLRYVLLPVHS